jgi:hypothetical protein
VIDCNSLSLNSNVLSILVVFCQGAFVLSLAKQLSGGLKVNCKLLAFIFKHKMFNINHLKKFAVFPAAWLAEPCKPGATKILEESYPVFCLASFNASHPLIGEYFAIPRSNALAPLRSFQAADPTILSVASFIYSGGI